MAGNNIKGITIEIGGDTTGLEESLKDVNKRSKTLQTELREVQKALNLDPSNTELVRQKQELLTRSIAETSTKLGALKQAQAQVEQQFREGKIGEEQYRAFQRELQSTEAQLRRYETQLQSVGTEQDKLARNQKDLQTYLNATGRTVDDLSNVLGTRLTNAIKDGSATADQLELALNRIARQAGHSGQDLEQFRRTLRNIDNGSNLDQIRQDLDRIGDQANETKKDISALKDGLKDAANAASIATVALGGAALLSAAQFDNAVGQIQAGLGVTREEAEALEAQAREVWKAGFGESLEEVSASLIRVKQNMKGLSENEIEGATKSALSLAKAFDSDVVEVTRAANNMMSNFGLTSQEAFDKMAKGAQNGLNFSNEMFDNLAEYAPLFADAGYSADEMFNLLEKGTAKGVYNLDYLNDVIKEFGIRLVDGSKGTTDAMSELFAPKGIDEFVSKLTVSGQKTKEYGELVKAVGKTSADEMVKNLQKGGTSAEKAVLGVMGVMGDYNKVMDGISNGSISTSSAMDMIIGKLNEIDDPIQRNMLGVQLFGTKWEDLGADVVLSLGGVKGALTDTEGTMASLIEVQEQTFGQRWESFTRKTAESLQPLGEILLKLAEEWLPKVISVVESVAKWFDNLSPAAQKIVIVIGAIIAIVGPLITILGIMIPIIGNVIGLFSAGGVAAGFFGGALAILTSPITLIIAAIVALIAIGVLLYKNWDTIKEYLLIAWEGIKSAAETVWNAITAYFKWALNLYLTIFTTIWNAICAVTVSVWNAIKNAIMTPINLVKSGIETAVGFIKQHLSFSGLSSTVSGIFETIKGYMVNPIQKAKDLISKIVDGIKGFFSNLSLKIPDIKLPKLPKFSMEGKFSLTPPSVPKLKVKWNALGGIFSKPTIFNTANAGLQGVGEAGPEAILPLNAQTLASIGKGIAEQMGGMSGQEIVVPVTLQVDGHTFAQYTAKYYSKAQYNENNIAQRGRG